MTYEDEQIKYAEELKEITFAISRLDEIFEDSSVRFPLLGQPAIRLIS